MLILNHIMSTWGEYYSKNAYLALITNQWRKRHTFSLIRNLDIKNALEIGAGTGFCADFFAKKKHLKLTLLDNDKKIIKRLKNTHPDKQIVHADILQFETQQKWDLVYSLGVIEHFKDNDREKVITMHKKLSSNYVLIAVPVDSFIRRKILNPIIERQIGYEKLYRKHELKKEMVAAGLKPIKTKSNFLGTTILAQI